MGNGTGEQSFVYININSYERLMYSREVLDMIEIQKCTKERKKVNHVDCEEVERRRTNEKNQKISFSDFSIPMYGCRSRLASCYGKH